MSFWLLPQNEFDSCSGYAQKCGQLAWSPVVSGIVCALHIAHCSRGKEAACRQKQSVDCLQLQALSCKMENIFDSHYIQKASKELSTSQGGLWIIGRDFLIVIYEVINQMLTWKHIRANMQNTSRVSPRNMFVSFYVSQGLSGFQVLPSIEAIVRSHPHPSIVSLTHLADSLVPPLSLYKSGEQRGLW